MSNWLYYLKSSLKQAKNTDQLTQNNQNNQAGENIKVLLPFIKKHWPAGLLGVCLIIVSSFLSYPQPMITRYLIDKVLLGKQFNLLGLIIILLAAIKLLQTIADLFQRFYSTSFEQAVLLDIRHDLLNRVLHFPKAFFDSQETGYLMSRLNNDLESLRWFFSSTLVQILTNSLRFVIGLGFLFYLEWRIALVTIIVLPLLSLSVKYFSQKIKVLSRQRMEKQAKLSARLKEALGSLSLIKSFSTEKREIAKIMQEAKQANEINLQQTALSSVASLSISGLSELASLILLAAGGWLIIKGEWTVGSLLAFQAYLGFVFGPAQFLANSNYILQSALAGLERVATFYTILPEEHNEAGQKPAKLNGKIEFRHVSFSYNGQEMILKDLSFIINPGEKIAIVGPSGAGKTTLISLMLAFYSPINGTVLFDDQLVSAYNLKSLRERLGYVAQSTQLLSGSIIDNLKYGNEQATHEELVKSAKAAGIDEYISKLPAGYNSLLGENGVNMSEGQRQRLSIARALVKNPDILIFDEPTSNLDLVTEKNILDLLNNLAKNKTLIIISHRPVPADRMIAIS
ncbi:hypothetical protein COT42_08365 [Candidatus Saganbacteria bacterium CG08_land_8_20_14_0_20_45_16]|uniref:ABC transporter ATP-binding protein n=1 Tax=Candidatus Saganbacteria bacterium CG08_land_8_20_14_0_20_45_16 TaxID=2014293 RepID=A0A2H0XTT5_UNCSA|nr:MAG: hypothetical protein COT42_08365 [Candidatus Saganbacteria bacterium CG08_land_8_20_14_0_20_45_16]